MQAYSVTIASATVTPVTVNGNADRVLISNRSSQDVLVSFQPAQPTAASGPGQQWPVIVHAGDQLIFTLRDAQKSVTPLGAYWTGTLWLCAIGQPSGLAYTGTISASALVYVTELLPGDVAPLMAAKPTAVDASSQARVLAVPVSGGFLQAGSWNSASFSSVSVYAIAPSAANIANGSLNLYIYYLQLVPAWGLGNFGTGLNLNWNFLTGGGAQITSGTILPVDMTYLYTANTSPAYNMIWEYNPVWPGVVQINVPSNAATFTVFWAYGSGFKNTFNWIATMSIDPTNKAIPGAIGNQLYYTYGSGNGPF